MAKLYNLAAMTVNSTGTGTITLGSAATINGVLYLSFAGAGVSNGETVAYSINDVGGSEVGTGVYTSSGTTLTRTPISSTNSNNAINMTSRAIVRISPAKEDVANLREINVFTERQIFGPGSGSASATNPAKVTISKAAGAAPMTASMFGDPVLHCVGEDTFSANQVLSAHGNATAKFWLTQARGVAGAPTQTLDGDHVGGVLFSPYNATTGYTQAAIILGRSTDNQTNTAQGMALDFYGTPDGTASVASQMSVQSGVVIGPAATAMPGAGNLTVTGAINASAWSTYTPTVTSQSGSITSYTATGRYRQGFGRVVVLETDVVINTVGTAANNMIVTLPVNAAAFRYAGISFDYGATFKSGAGYIAGATDATKFNTADSTGNTFFAAFAKVVSSISYESV